MVGRKREMDCLKNAFLKKEAQLVAVYGRRRVGKTYLVRETFGGKFYFQHSGVANETMAGQLAEFRDSLVRAGAKEVPRFTSWREGFNELEKFIVAGGLRRKKVLFIDEMPWMDTPKSGFVSAFEAFWNGWCSGRKDVLLIICGSASSWIVKNVFRNRGGLYNRVSERIHLQPFTLRECREMCLEKSICFSNMDIAELYMAMGGIPYYWSKLVKGESVARAIDRLFFSSDGALRGEFAELYLSLFGSSVQYEKIIRTLASVKSGMSKEALLASSGIGSGGNANRYLDALEECGFVRRFTAFGKKKRDAQYQLIDNFSLFHLRFLDGESNHDEHFWSNSTSSAALNAWRGLAFERLGLLHVRQINKALGITGVLTNTYSWRHEADGTYPWGVQIDLLLERADRVVNVCEFKFAKGEFVVTAEYEKALNRKCETFSAVTGSRSATHVTLVTTNGVAHNSHYGVVQSEVTLDDLFT